MFSDYLYDDSNLDNVEYLLVDALMLFYKRFSLYDKIPKMEYSYFNAAAADCINYLLHKEKYINFKKYLSKDDLEVINRTAAMFISNIVLKKNNGGDQDPLNLSF